MKKLLGFAVVLLIFLSSCSKFLDKQPLSQISPNNAFNNESELQLYVRSFYDRMLPTADNDDVFYSLYTETGDNIVLTGLDSKLAGNRSVPLTDATWDWSNLRNVNYFLQNYSRGKLDTSITNKYVATARFFRALFYSEMVARYGDVPWYSKVIEANDTAALNKPRDSRTLVMDSVVSDIDFAIAHLGTDKNNSEVNKWTALALKSRFCLFEGTFRKYHPDFKLTNTADRFLQLAADAANQVITTGPYVVYKTTPDNAYRDLFSSLSVVDNEVILARSYVPSQQIYHNVNYYTIAPSFGKPGLEKRLVNSYLMKDGSRFTDIPGYATMQFGDEMKNRDPRLTQTVRGPGYTRIGSTVKLAPSYGSTCTGYQLTKFVTAATNDALGKSPNPLPIFRYAEVLLNYAEAKAELNTLTNADLDVSINQLRDRVAMPHLDMNVANANPDPYLVQQYISADVDIPGANKGVILEIRRERRIELVMEGFVWNDLMRWKEGHMLVPQFKGAYFPGPGSFDLDNDGVADLALYTDTPPANASLQLLKLGVDVQLENGAAGGNIVVNPQIAKHFREDRDYLYPIPTQEVLLNPNLGQNLNW